MLKEGRPTRPEATTMHAPELDTFSGAEALKVDEPLIFEIGRDGHCGVDLPEPQLKEHRLGALARTGRIGLPGLSEPEVVRHYVRLSRMNYSIDQGLFPLGSCTMKHNPRLNEKMIRLGALARTGRIGLPGLSEPEVVRHYVRLSRMNYSIDQGLFPLGSCTMKHNPRLNEKMIRLPGFADAHPLAPKSTVQGALEVMEELGRWLVTMTGMAAVALSPKAGAHGELCGLMAIKAAHEAKGEGAIRKRVLVPESAHGTNPATAALCGYTVDAIPATPDGRVDLAAFAAKLGPDVAAIMITNPNTCGLFERDIIRIAEDVHRVGGYFYCDGANFNAIVGKVRPGDLGVDAMHINLHKTFSTPHGGGGPGSGPVVLSEALAPFAPVPFVRRDGGRLTLVEHVGDAGSDAHPFGRMVAFHGQMGMYVRALAYMMSHGSDGLWQVAEDAVLNANYVLAGLKDVMTAPFEGPCMHEALFDDRFLEGTGITTLDIAKAMIDEGYHPMTMYFPLVVRGAMLIEPTETESKESLDRFIDVMRKLAQAAKSGDTARFKGAPHFAPRARLDETQAARNPVLRWEPKGEARQAAE